MGTRVEAAVLWRRAPRGAQLLYGAHARGSSQMLALFISLQDKQEDLTSGYAPARAGPGTCRHTAGFIVLGQAMVVSPLLT